MNIIPGLTFFNPSSLLKTRPSTGKVQGSRIFTLNYVTRSHVYFHIRAKSPTTSMEPMSICDLQPSLSRAHYKREVGKASATDEELTVLREAIITGRFDH